MRFSDILPATLTLGRYDNKGTIREKEVDFTYFGLKSGSSLPEISGISKEYQEIFQASTLLIEFINDQYSLTRVGMMKMKPPIIVTDYFKEVFDPIIKLKCEMIIFNLNLYLTERRIINPQYLLGVHELDEDQYSKKIPYIEIRVPVTRVADLLDIWEDAIDFLKKLLPETELENIDIFFTRA